MFLPLDMSDKITFSSNIFMSFTTGSLQVFARFRRAGFAVQDLPTEQPACVCGLALPHVVCSDR